METSAVESINVDEAFNKLTQIVYDRLESSGLLSRRTSSTFQNHSPVTNANVRQPGKSGEEARNGCC